MENLKNGGHDHGTSLQCPPIRPRLSSYLPLPPPGPGYSHTSLSPPGPGYSHTPLFLPFQALVIPIPPSPLQALVIPIPPCSSPSRPWLFPYHHLPPHPGPGYSHTSLFLPLQALVIPIPPSSSPSRPWLFQYLLLPHLLDPSYITCLSPPGPGYSHTSLSPPGPGYSHTSLFLLQQALAIPIPPSTCPSQALVTPIPPSFSPQALVIPIPPSSSPFRPRLSSYRHTQCHLQQYYTIR